MRGRSGRPELGERTSGAGLLLSRRLWVREVGEESLELDTSRELEREWERSAGFVLVYSRGRMSREPKRALVWTMLEMEGSIVRCEHFILRFLTPFTMRSLSPILAMPISLRVSWSSSNRISPRISLFLKVGICAAHLLSASHRATWASFQVRMKSEKVVP
jgi:hypothetical protein